MANNLIPANLQIPAHLQGRIGKPSVLSQAIVGGIGSGAFPRISIKGSRFRLVEGDTETPLESLAIDVVIVGANPRLSKTYYIKQWSPDSEPEMPDCYSLDGIAPLPDSPALQNDICATCQWNAWGSKINPITGKEQKACADQKRLAVVAADDPEGPIYLLQVTPAALKGLNQFQKELSVRGIPPEIIKTRISFDTDASFPLLHFSLGGFLDNEAIEAVEKLFGSPQVMEVTGESTTPVQPVPVQPQVAPPTPATPPKLAAVPAVVAKPAPAPTPAPAAAAEPEQPKRGFGAAKGVTKLKTAAKNGGAPASAPTAQAAPAAQVKAAGQAPVAGSASALSLADEIAALVGEVSADDA